MQERLQKIIARAGISSRRKAEELIARGDVTVNERVITHLGEKADATVDDIRVGGKLIAAEVNTVYVMLNKPAGYVTSVSDPQKRPVVMDLVKDIPERLFPVGRLDYDSEGLLLLTNDGDFAHQIQHPRFEVAKTYRVKVKGALTQQVTDALSRGVSLDNGVFRPSDFSIEKKNPGSFWLVLTIHDGRNRIIRRAFESLGMTVVRLIRIAVGDIKIAGLPEGEYRHLTEKEVKRLLVVKKNR